MFARLHNHSPLSQVSQVSYPRTCSYLEHWYKSLWCKSPAPHVASALEFKLPLNFSFKHFNSRTIKVSAITTSCHVPSTATNGASDLNIHDGAGPNTFKLSKPQFATLSTTVSYSFALWKDLDKNCRMKKP